MIKIIVASNNPVKINATKEAFASLFPETEFEVSGHETDSGVSDQPMSEQEAYDGAYNRAKALNKNNLADYYVGIEAGLIYINNELYNQAQIVVMDNQGLISQSRTSIFKLPKIVATLVKEGRTLGDASDEFFNITGVGSRNGTCGVITGDVIDRTRYFFEPLVFAFSVFKHSDMY